jgi:hypothetical protein
MSVIVLSALSADGTDPATGLVLHPGIAFSQSVDSPVCHSHSKMDLYDSPPGAAMSEYLAWYKTKLSDYRLVPQSWSGRAQNDFYSADGTKVVSITGMPHGDGVYAITYIAITPALKPQEIGKFSPSNPQCN